MFLKTGEFIVVAGGDLSWLSWLLVAVEGKKVKQWREMIGCGIVAVSGCGGGKRAAADAGGGAGVGWLGSSS